MWKEAQNPELEGHLSEEGEVCPRECDCRSTDLITEERSVPHLVLSSLQMTWEKGKLGVGSGPSSASKLLCNFEYFAHPF